MTANYDPHARRVGQAYSRERCVHGFRRRRIIHGGQRVHVTTARLAAEGKEQCCCCADIVPAPQMYLDICLDCARVQGLAPQAPAR